MEQQAVAARAGRRPSCLRVLSLTDVSFPAPTRCIAVGYKVAIGWADHAPTEELGGHPPPGPPPPVPPGHAPPPPLHHVGQAATLPRAERWNRSRWRRLSTKTPSPEPASPEPIRGHPGRHAEGEGERRGLPGSFAVRPILRQMSEAAHHPRPPWPNGPVTDSYPNGEPTSSLGRANHTPRTGSRRAG